MFKENKYLDSGGPELNRRYDSVHFKWNPEAAKFDSRLQKGHSFNRRQAQTIETYLHDIQSNRWVTLYHKGHCCVAVVVMVTGLLLFFTVILPILLIGVGIYILFEKEKYYEYVFKKMMVSLENIEAANKQDLMKVALKSKLSHNKGNRA